MSANLSKSLYMIHHDLTGIYIFLNHGYPYYSIHLNIDPIAQCTTTDHSANPRNIIYIFCVHFQLIYNNHKLWDMVYKFFYVWSFCFLQWSANHESLCTSCHMSKNINMTAVACDNSHFYLWDTRMGENVCDSRDRKG